MNNTNIVDILIVEDNPLDAEIILRALKLNNLENSIYLVEDGAEAIDFLFCKGKYESRSIHTFPKVVLLDLKLPKLNGLEVLKMIKEDVRTMQIPIVIVTSSSEEPDIIEAYQLGANSHVVKPVDFRVSLKTYFNTNCHPSTTLRVTHQKGHTEPSRRVFCEFLEDTFTQFTTVMNNLGLYWLLINKPIQ